MVGKGNLHYRNQQLLVPTPHRGASPITDVSEVTQAGVASIIDSTREGKGLLHILDFAHESSEGVFINIRSFENILDLQSSLDRLFQTGHYLVDFDYQKISRLLFGEGEVGADPIRIASAIVKIDPQRQALYRKLMVARDKRSAQYFFEPVYLFLPGSDGIETEQKTFLNIDEFIAHMWSEGIRQGIHIDEIQSAIDTQRKGLVVVATETDPTETYQPKLDPVISFEIKQAPKNGGGSARADFLTYEQGYVRVAGNAPLYKKIPGKIGIPGWSIFGEKIDPEPIRDFDIGELKGNGVTIQVIDGIEHVCSEYNGFPRIEEGIVQQGSQRVKQILKIHVDRDKVFDRIGMPTGRVEVEEGIISENDVGLDIVHALTVHAKKDVEANIRAKKNIRVDGSIFGTASTSIITRKRQGVGMTPKGTLISEDGDIVVGGMINGAVLEARHGDVSVSRIGNSLVVGKTVMVGDSAYNTTIVADSVIIRGKTIGCRILARSVYMEHSEQKGEHENIVSVFLHDYADQIQIVEAARQKLIEQVHNIESRIDRDIVARFKSLERFDFGKRVSMTRILVEIMADPSKRNNPQYIGYVQIYNLLAALLRTYGTDWQKIKEFNLRLDALTQEREKMKEAQEREISNSGIQVSRISSRTLLRTLLYKGVTSLLELTPEQIIELSDYQIGGDVAQSCSIKSASEASSGSIEYRVNPYEK